MPNAKKPSNNVFQNIVRTVVREELGTVEKKIDHRFMVFEERMNNKFNRFEKGMNDKFISFEKGMNDKFISFEKGMNDKFISFEERMEEKLDNTFGKFRNEIMTALDQIMGMFKKHDEEHDILSGQHGRLIDVEERVEKLEVIHSLGQHP